MSKTSQKGEALLTISVVADFIRFKNDSLYGCVDLTLAEAKAMRRGLSRCIRILEQDRPEETP